MIQIDPKTASSLTRLANDPQSRPVMDYIQSTYWEYVDQLVASDASNDEMRVLQGQCRAIRDLQQQILSAAHNERAAYQAQTREGFAPSIAGFPATYGDSRYGTI